MKDKLFRIYNETEIIRNQNSRPEVKFHCDFKNQPIIEIFSLRKKGKYLVSFIDAETEKTLYETTVIDKGWVKVNREFYTDWKITVKEDSQLLFSYKLELKGRRVLINLESNLLGDTIAWLPYAEEFRKKHDCRVILASNWGRIFDEHYKFIEFVKPGTIPENIFISYHIGLYWGNNLKNRNDCRSIPLQQISSDTLGLEFKEIRPLVKIPVRQPLIKSKYVCIAEHTTIQAKYWNYPGGWQEVVNYLNEKGYKVVVISKEQTTLKNIIDRTGSLPIEDTINDLHHSSFFIGISSGLSWLSWAVGKQVILISGYTAPVTEFKTNIIRIHNQEVCNSCYNDTSYYIDHPDWFYCPRLKYTDRRFECSTSIKPSDVFKAIDQLISI
jgi:autotransporter strand-loop-strand O-heptosyltransferase